MLQNKMAVGKKACLYICSPFSMLQMKGENIVNFERWNEQ